MSTCQVLRYDSFEGLEDGKYFDDVKVLGLHFTSYKLLWFIIIIVVLIAIVIIITIAIAIIIIIIVIIFIIITIIIIIHKQS